MSRGREAEDSAGAERKDGGALEAVGRPVEAAGAEVLQVRGVVRHYQGPLPTPAMLRGYEEVVPGSGERILAMAERQAAHRQNIESRGQLFGFSLAASAIAGAFLSAAVGLPLVGVSGVLLAAATLSGFFIWGKAGGLRRVPTADRREGDHSDD